MTHFLTAEQTSAALEMGPLIDAIDGLFETGCDMPVRHHHSFDVPGEEAGTLLVMPAWRSGDHLGVKMVNVVPGNGARGLPVIAGVYILSSAKTGELQAIMDGAELTARRTAAASALAAKYLSRPNARRLLIVGAGKLSLNLIEAHSVHRQFDVIEIWARRLVQAVEVAEKARALGFTAVACTDLAASARVADVISCCTLSREPLVLGQWLNPGAHLDLIGAFKPDMRECDDAAIVNASVFADTRDGVFAEGGDILQPLKAGLISEDHVKADLYDLCRGHHAGRRDDQEITVFKSVGAALEDLAGAMLVYKSLAG